MAGSIFNSSTLGVQFPWNGIESTLMLLFFRSLLWVVLLPGTVVLAIPYLIVTRYSPSDVSSWGPAQFIGVSPMVIGAAILASSVWNFAASGRGTLSPIDAPRQLVVSGLYRYVRNPMYLGVLLILIGEALWFESSAITAYAAGWFLLVNLVVLLYEEPSLRRRFGASYDHYCRSVRRWLPGKRFNVEL